MKAVAAVCAALLAVMCLSSCAGASQQHSASAAQSTAEADHNDVDHSFARKMVTHHEQTVEMALMVTSNTKNQQVIDLANRIYGSQVSELQAFRSFLMKWSDAQGHDTAGQGVSAAGMVAQSTIDKSKSMSGPEFDRLWLTSMIDHHRGAITMAQDEVAHGRNSDVIYLARSIITSEQPEIDQMNQMLGG